MATDPNDPIRRVVEEEETVAPRGEDAEHIVEPDDEDSPGEEESRDRGDEDERSRGKRPGSRGVDRA